MTPSSSPREPKAFSIDEATPARDPDLPDALPPLAGELSAPTTPRPRPRRGWRWGRLLLTSLTGLAALAVTIWVSNQVTSLLEGGGVFGWIALSLAALAGLALLAIVLREVIGIARLTRLRRLREAADAAVVSDAAARRIIADLRRLYASRPELAPAAAEMAAHDEEIVDPADRIVIAERAFMPSLDAEANRLIADATARVSLITAISPAAIVDLGVVLVTQIALLRRIAELYGGRPGAFGLVRLARLVITHLALTGSIAFGDDVIQQVIGHSLAARLSARLGEGVLNGLMTARIGIAALDICRPLPFRALNRPRVTDFAALERTSLSSRGRDNPVK